MPLIPIEALVFALAPMPHLRVLNRATPLRSHALPQADALALGLQFQMLCLDLVQSAHMLP